MISLKVFRDKAESLTDLMQFAVMLDQHTVLCKNGLLMSAIKYSGKDVDSSTVHELNANSQINKAALDLLGSGWCTYHNACRHESSEYMPFTTLDDFPDEGSRLIEAERRQRVDDKGTTYENNYVLILCWMPDSVKVGKAKDMLYTDEGGESGKSTAADRNLEYFQNGILNFTDRLSSLLQMELLGDYEFVDKETGYRQTCNAFLEHLDYCVSGEYQRIAVPDNTMYLDNLIGGYDFNPGIVPMVGEKYVATVVVDGFPMQSWPQILNGLDALPFEYRWSNRFIYLDEHEAVAEINKYRRKWAQKERGFKDQISQKSDGRLDRHAGNMINDVDDAYAEVSAGLGYGYYTSTIVIMHEDQDLLLQYAKEVRKVFTGGFVARIETVNAIEAYLGAIPGHIDANVRRPLISIKHLSNLLPLSSIWSGGVKCENNLYPENSPMLMQAETKGSTPFRFNNHVNDVGHMLILGKTGTGKSVFMQMLIAQSRRYANSKIFAFDKGYSGYALCKAMGGNHFDVGSEHQDIYFCPLEDIDQDSELQWAVEWIEICCGVEGLTFTPALRNSTFEALQNLRGSDTRSLTEFVASVQENEIREAMQGFLIDGRYGELLDANTNNMTYSNVNVFEIGSLMELGKATLPTLLYLLRQVKRASDGHPGFLFVDEAWVALGHPVFADKLDEFLRELRKDCWSVIMATQSPKSVVESSIGDVIIDQCMTKILLPNPDALSDTQFDIYNKSLGLNEAQINLIASAIPKRQYYYTSPNGNRLFELTLGPKTLALTGVAAEAGRDMIDSFITKHGDDKWLDAYLETV